MTNYVHIAQGNARGNVVENVVFPLVKGLSDSAKGTFVTVDASRHFGIKRATNVRVYCDPSSVKTSSEEAFEAQGFVAAGEEVAIGAGATKADAERMEEIAERFDILQDMTKAMLQKKIRGMIVSGPPGVGKSFGVERELEKVSLFSDMGGRARRSEVVKGAMSALGLYCKLHEYRNDGDVLVFDDCDSVLMDDLSLNLLKAALDSGRTRRLFWNSDSKKLREEGIENSFEFKGSVIFITNIQFENVRSKRLQDHLQALMSRCHYLDLTLNTMRDKILRVKQIAATGQLFANYNFSKDEQEEVLDFMYENCKKLREVSLRMALKIADCKLVNGERWKTFARATCMKNG